MTDIDDETADELTLRYRRASGGDPSRPSDPVREAIRAQARKAMTYRTTRAADEAALAQMKVAPAANDSRWNLRAVAGLAGVGLAGLLAFQAFRNTPGPETPRATFAAESVPAAPAPPARPDDAAQAVTGRKSAAPSAFPRNATESLARSAPQLAATAPPTVRLSPMPMPRELHSADVAGSADADSRNSNELRSESKATGAAPFALAAPAAPATPEQMHFMGKVLVHAAGDRRHVIVAVDQNGNDAIHHLFLYATSEIVTRTSSVSGLGSIDYTGGSGLRVTLTDSGETFVFPVSSPPGSLQHYFTEKYLPMKDLEALLGRNEGCAADFDQCLALAGMGVIRVP